MLKTFNAPGARTDRPSEGTVNRLPTQREVARDAGLSDLKLVEDDDGVHGGQQPADALAAMKDVPDMRRKKIEADPAVFAGKP